MRLGVLRLRLQLVVHTRNQRGDGCKDSMQRCNCVAVADGELLSVVLLDLGAISVTRAGCFVEARTQLRNLSVHLAVHTRERVTVPFMQLRLSRKVVAADGAGLAARIWGAIQGA